jgi:hypothetical protein
MEANFQTMIKVLRKQKFVKKDELMCQESYYLSNISTKNIQVVGELFDSIRNYWQVEVNNYIRDVVLKEDNLCMLNLLSTKAAACLFLFPTFQRTFSTLFKSVRFQNI